MNKFYRAAAVAAMLGSIGFIGMGTASASDGGRDIAVSQSAKCVSHDLNLDVLGEVGVLNGVLGNALNGEGNPGAQATQLGSNQGCTNSAF
ncbi:hypothetical protein [Actinacidiphila paucisporea]|uniref:Secreted protein n=1 Tax=Actinacidiphila paucisporea TaxID=310782 RepID=A0A1M7CSL1_9ACTN|nr:hypothetical protein [Actinacidiphila paucisporea]SHL69839.1 hypothetical protein SAMN05216499_105327 [Actinacidiphila paucisporea]